MIEIPEEVEIPFVGEVPTWLLAIAATLVVVGTSLYYTEKKLERMILLTR